MTDPPERRVFSDVFRLAELETGQSGRFKMLEGRAVPYQTFADVGWYMEQHAAGSFDRSTRGGTGKPGLPLLLFHDNRSTPVGHAIAWRSDGTGLLGRWQLNETPKAQEAAQLAKDGDLTGMSIGFAPIHSEWERATNFNPDLGPDHMDRVTRLESRLIEVSLTPTPAFEDATISLVRSAERRPNNREEVEAWQREIDALRR